MLNKLAGVPAGVQAIEAVGTVTTDDYHRVFAPLVDEACRTRDRLRLLYRFGPGFARITPGALWADARLGADYVRLLDGCAVVSDIDWIRIPTRRIAMFMPAPVRVYDDSGVSDALTWLQSLPRNTDVSALGMARAYTGGIGAGLVSLAELIVSKRRLEPARRQDPGPSEARADFRA